ncbi:YIEGIA family protein [Calderihabitans maritimus]|uniref:Sporulation protein SeaA n=1 Tax=Calderihabitans maritimus TaxID=1246530 RepID=A0A1Z5HUP1_9FIRM|nr:YIEGIA family protein [Calderihabitans maritimus]GAW93232.1 sporulation protein SeaA [Calderihabitans maritimus]
MEKYGLTVLIGLAFGTLARLYMLRIDYRQYPSYPHGAVTHISLGFIAAALGSVAIPALAEKEFTAVTFLALAAQQFREIRNMEREMLTQLEEAALVRRGLDYIEGIARVFEARNYLVMVTALATSSANYFAGWPYAVLTGLICIFLNTFVMRGRMIGDIAEVVPARLHFEGAFLKVDHIVIMNVGLKASREKILAEGLGVLIKPKDDNARATLHNAGQRQAILHVAASLLGTKREVGEQEWTPLVRKDIDTGALGLFILPVEKDMECLIEAIKKVPVLESAKTRPLSSKAGRCAAD